MEREGCLVKTIWDATRFPLIFFTTINMSCFSPSTVGEDSNIEIDSRHISIALNGHDGITASRHLLSSPPSTTVSILCPHDASQGI